LREAAMANPAGEVESGVLRAKYFLVSIDQPAQPH
jgi:hypothetical protein